MSKRKIKIRYSCSDFSHHEHKYWITAYLCGQLQRWFASREEEKLFNIWRKDIEKASKIGFSNYEQIFGKDESAGGGKCVHKK